VRTCARVLVCVFCCGVSQGILADREVRALSEEVYARALALRFVVCSEGCDAIR